MATSKKIKAILIDPSEGIVKDVEIDNELESYYRQIGCRLITSASIDTHNDVIVDDEGLMIDPEYFFSVDDEGEPQYAGKGLIVGVNPSTGDFTNTTLTALEIASRLVFYRIRNLVVNGVRICQHRNVSFPKQG